MSILQRRDAGSKLREGTRKLRANKCTVHETKKRGRNATENVAGADAPAVPA